MVHLRRQIILNAFKLFDLLIMGFSFLLATSAISYQVGTVSLVDFLSMRVKIQNVVLLITFFALWHIILSVCGLYHSRRLSTHWAEVVDVVKATSLGTLTILSGGILFSIEIITPVFVAVFWVLSTGTIISIRLILRCLLAQMRIHGRNLRHMLIVGTNLRAVHFAEKIKAGPENGYRLIGFVDDEWGGIDEFRKTEYHLAGNLSSLPRLLRERVIDEVVIALPIKSFYARTAEIVAQCEEQGIVVRFGSEIFNPTLARSASEEFEDSSVISFYTGSMHGWSVWVKRAFDFSFSYILLVLLSPLFVVTGLLIKVTSKGPVFFSQERVGINKRRFRLYKFRTMIADAEQKLAEIEHLNEVSGPVFKIKDDPRITAIGRILRRTSIDELPQLFNVLKGDMSLVGPRPLPVRDVDGFGKDWQRRRFSVRPGITCLWQVNGRSDLPFENWMELDMQYIDQWSLWLDLKILARTVPVVLRGSGAA
jgi:exopolysaccharide biosynthesis polyprenyl glycosylphosphotransferase